MAEKPAKKAESKAVETMRKKVDPWKVLDYPHLTEKSMNMVEIENKLVFIVDRKFNKDQIKAAIENQFNVKVEDVKTLVNTKGKKKAICTLSADYIASDIASQLGMM